MLVNKTYKFRMYLTKEQEHIVNKFIGSSRFIYNYYLYENKDNKFFNYYDASKDLVRLKEENEWLKEVDSCLLKNTLKDLSLGYDRYNKGQGGYPRYKKKSLNGSYRTTAIRSTYKGKENCSIEVDLERNLIKLPKLKEVKIRGYRNLSTFPHKILNAIISKEAGRYYVSVCAVEDIPYKEFTLRNVVGIDLGIKNLVVTSDGIKYNKMANLDKIEKKLKGLNKWLSRSQKGSKNREKIILKIERLNMKLKNLRKYRVHEITSTLVKDNDLIITETLKVNNMVKNHHLSKRILHSSLSEIIRQLEYKCKWFNKKLIKIDTFYASSQICNHSGYKNRKVKDLSVRKWTCENCKSELDRDINAAINIEWEGVTKYFREQYSN